MLRLLTKGSAILAAATHKHLVLPFTESSAPISHISWGASIGMFVAFTPTVGIQMYMVAVIWVCCRALGLRFNLPIGMALVWISNPLTAPPMYYGYLLTGDVLLGMEVSGRNFETFRMLFEQEQSGGNLMVTLLDGLLLLFWHFGWPMLVGSLIWALPLALLTYPLSTLLMLRYRFLLARRDGLSYAEWKAKHLQFH